MLINSSMWIFLNLDDQARLYGASACAYIGMMPEQIKLLLEPVHSRELNYKIGVARDLGFIYEKDKLRVTPEK